MTDKIIAASHPNIQSNPTTNNSNKPSRIAIIGGGLTGLFTATLLERQFAGAQPLTDLPQMTIFEKSRSVGRLATRYRTDEQTGQNWQWSFGAQFFTVKTEGFKQFIAPWLDNGLLQPWLAKVVHLTDANDDGQPPKIEPKEQWDSVQARYISTPKMTSWGRELAKSLQHTSIQFKTRVAPLAQYSELQAAHQSDNQTELFDENGQSLGLFDWVICTAPNSQAFEIMADSGFSEQAKITESKMLACYTLMLGWDAVQPLPSIFSEQTLPKWDVAYVQHSILDRLFVEQSKPSHDQLLPSVTIHARNDWSEQHVDGDIEAIKTQLLTAAQRALNWNERTAPTQIDCHRWRYAATVMDKNGQPLGLLVDQKNHWIVSGDWCDKGNIESCYRMAEQTVMAMTANLSKQVK